MAPIDPHRIAAEVDATLGYDLSNDNRGVDRDQHLREDWRAWDRGDDLAAARNGHPIRWTSAAEIMSTDYPPPRWAVPDVIPEGLTLLVSRPKLGKSWLALGLALSIAAGGQVLGRIPVEAGDVALLALEDTPRRLQVRMRMLLGDDPVPDGLRVTTDAPRLDQGLLAHLDALDTRRLRLVVVDVLQKVRPRNGADSVYERDYAVVSALKGWSDQHGIAVLVLHHDRKAAADDWLDTVSGSLGLTGAADGIALLRRSRGEADAALRLTGRDLDERDLALRFDRTRGAWTLLDGDPAELELSDTRRKILDVLRDHEEPLGPTAVAMAARLEVEVVKKALQRMVRAGQVWQSGRGRYVSPVPYVPSSPSGAPEGTAGTVAREAPNGLSPAKGTEGTQGTVPFPEPPPNGDGAYSPQVPL